MGVVGRDVGADAVGLDFAEEHFGVRFHGYVDPLVSDDGAEARRGNVRDVGPLSHERNIQLLNLQVAAVFNGAQVGGVLRELPGLGVRAHHHGPVARLALRLPEHLRTALVIFIICISFGERERRRRRRRRRRRVHSV